MDPIDPATRARILQALDDDERRDAGEMRLSQAAAPGSSTSGVEDPANRDSPYQPLSAAFRKDLARKLTVSRKRTWQRAVYSGLSLSVMTAVIVFLVLDRRDYAPRDVEIASDTAPRYPGGSQRLGQSPVTPSTSRLVLGPCVQLRFVPRQADKTRIDVRAFLQREAVLVPWPLQLAYDADSGIAYQHDGCAAPPKVEAGDWEAVFAVGEKLPADETLTRMVKARELPPKGARFQVERKPVLIQQ